jgi:hypothetical protein
MVFFLTVLSFCMTREKDAISKTAIHHLIRDYTHRCIHATSQLLLQCYTAFCAVSGGSPAVCDEEGETLASRLFSFHTGVLLQSVASQGLRR